MTDPMSDITSEQMAEWRALTKAATEGPWRWSNTRDVYLFGDRQRVVQAFGRMGMQGAQPLFRDDRGILCDSSKANLYDFADAAFIAAARTAVPALLDTVERLTAERDEWEEAACIWEHRVETRDLSFDELTDRANKAEAERDAALRDVAILRPAAAHAERAEAELRALREGVEALAAHWASCWCGPQMAPEHDPRRQDCPQCGDEAATYFAGGFVSTLRALLSDGPSA